VVSAGSFLLRGGAIYTMDPSQPWAQCVVVRGEMITYVGAEANAGDFTDAATVVIELDGGMCLPGFVDAHDHLANLALTKLGVDVSGITEPRLIVERIHDYAETRPDDVVIRGFGWTNTSFENESPTRAMLDSAVADRPAAILSDVAHDLWFNTAAMQAAGLDQNSPDPDPGTQFYVRETGGWPTGHAVEPGALIPVLAALGAFTDEGIRASQELTLKMAPSWGITSYMEAGVVLGPNASAEPIYADLVARDKRGEVDVRIIGTVWTREPSDDPAAVVATLQDWNARIRSEHVQISVLKKWADGTSLSGGALLLQPFEGCKTGDEYGHMTFSQDHIEHQIELAQQAGFDMHIHIDADGSARVVLDAIEAVQRRIGRGTSRHTVCHNTFVHPDDVKRFAQLGVIANCTPLWGSDYDGNFYDMYTEKLGAARMEERLYPYGDLVRSGAVVTYGADIPGVQIREIPPLIQIESLLTRKRPGFPDDRALVPRQPIGVHDALRGYTINGAYALRLEDKIGSLQVGKHADLVVLGENLFAVEPEDIHAVAVEMTMMDGRITHDARTYTERRHRAAGCG
jgi:predicted amidohydrolase YtcJ